MKLKTLNSKLGTVCKMQDQDRELPPSPQTDELYAANINWFAIGYYSPYVLMIDLSYVFDELHRMFQSRTVLKKSDKKPIIKIDEKI